MPRRRKAKIVRKHLNPNQQTVVSIRQYLRSTLRSFREVPPDNQYQHGYLACAETLYTDLFMTKDERAFARLPVEGEA